MQSFQILQLWLVRHGQTQDNVSRTIAGHSTSKLTQKGKKQASQLGERLQNTTFDKVFVSDLQRTKSTYQNIVFNWKLRPQVQFSPILRQKSGGIFTRKPLNSWDIQAKKFVQSKKGEYRQFKVEGAQSWQEVMVRAKQFIKILKYQASRGSKRILAVSHGGFIMQFENAVRQLKGQKAIYNNCAKNCSIHIYQLRFQGGQLLIECKLKNDNSHIIN